MTMRRILIANRGEIACRIIATCRRMGLASVAVYSDADADALHTRLADDAVRIGPAEASRSYLDADAVIAAALASGADAIHPGYGFLSERVVLARACEANGLTWIGPSPGCIEAMGSKIEAKRIARAAGIACVPGYDGDDQADARFAAEAEAIGYPVLVKASAGGGGRGMRRVTAAAELAGALASARAEAQAAFGSDILLLEKLIQRPRHLEVQLAGDRHGNLVHLFERECSIQRAYQKLLEEAPAPNLPESVRHALFDAATTLGRAIGYDSLGTAEFILEEGDDRPWFLEMNTRLQVEHPVTEQVTGVDLVEWQIRIARGEPLPLPQAGITLGGAAIEARLNAEDPAHDYRPGTGTLLRFDCPPAEGIRLETGVASGSVVTPFYDSLMAKLIAAAPDRPAAVARLAAALDRLVVLGVPCNQAFLCDIVAQETFRAGRLTTRFLEEAFPSGWQPRTGELVREAAVAAWLAGVRGEAPGPWSGLGGFRVMGAAGRPARLFLDVQDGADTQSITVTGTPDHFAIDGEEPVLAAVRDGIVTLRSGARTARFAVARQDDEVLRAAAGQSYRRRVRLAIEAVTRAQAAAGGPRLTAPMPGLIVSVEVGEGDRVEAGQVAVVMEAMKVNMRLPAPIAGRVVRVGCSAGETVRGDALLIEIEPDGGA
ncbi:MAG: biotin carboxylase N-terminal domain-containing protein [Acetobacteraceae bacterium]